MDNFKLIFERQKNFSKKIFLPEKMSTDEKINLTKEYILCLHKEVSEVLDSITWKTHIFYDKKKIYKDLYLEELIDVFKYLLNLLIIWDFNESDFIDMFNKKSDIVEKKFEKNIKKGLKVK